MRFHYSLVVGCGPHCNCPPDCSNRVQQNVTLPGLQHFCRDPKIGLGVRTTQDIGVGLFQFIPDQFPFSGQIVCELAGRITDLEPKDHMGIDPEYSWTMKNEQQDGYSRVAKWILNRNVCSI